MAVGDQRSRATHASVVRVAVVDVRIVRMGVYHQRVSMPMSMWRRISHWGVIR
jgi:hypothetical protein